jgi:DNA (cytosine-5)-methyltransferase 1
MIGKKKKLKVVDLFSGCGGLSYGFEQAGFDVILGIDNWEDSLKTFAINHPNSKTFLANLGESSVASICKKNGLSKGNIDVIVGGPPCQGFSIAGKRDHNDPRNSLYKAFVDFVRYLKPTLFILENVPNLVSMSQGEIKDTIIKDFSNLGYNINYQILKASDYGVPQNRRRVFFVGTTSKKKFEFPNPTFQKESDKITAAEAIGDLPENTLMDGLKYPNLAKSEYQKKMRTNSSGIYNHFATDHSEKTKEVIALVPDGGNYKNLPKHLQGTRKVNIAWTRLNSKKPSFTIDTGHRHHFHYSYNRIPTVRECARIQSFPDTFKFLGTRTSQYKQVGNAVPPLLAYVLGKELLKFFHNKNV